MGLRMSSVGDRQTAHVSHCFDRAFPARCEVALAANDGIVGKLPVEAVPNPVQPGGQPAVLDTLSQCRNHVAAPEVDGAV